MGLFDGTPLERPVTCERCGKELIACGCPRDAQGELRERGTIRARVRRERRRGNWCTVVTDLESTGEGGPTDLKALLRELRKGLGTGGGVDGHALVIQGDHRDAIVARLRAMGFDAKGAGG